MTSKVRVRAIAVVAGTGLLIGSAFGQAKGGGTTTPPTGTGTTGTTGTGAGTTGTTRPGSNTTSPTTPTQPSVAIPQPIYVSGRVMLEDGTAPPEPAVIETVCNGNTHGEGYTDAKGYFSLELGARHSMIQDASEFGTNNSLYGNSPSNNSGALSSAPLGGSAMDSAERKYMGCDLQAKLSGFRSQTVPLAGRRAMDDPNVGTILLHRTGPAEEGKTVSMISLQAPKDAKKAYDKGMDSVKKAKYEDAQKNFEKAVEAYPKYATAWYELGMLQVGQGKMDMARQYFQKSLDCDAKFIRPYLQLAVIALQSSKWQELAAVTDKIVKLDPFDYPQAYFFNSVANYNMQHFEDAEKSALEAERLDTRHQYPKNSHLLGMVLAMKKDYTGAAERLKAYLKFAPTAEDAPKVRQQLAEVEKITAASNHQ
jgi:tetratricopeptide (TPR) repeat protein